MTCSDYTPLLSAYLDRALPAHEQTSVARHVETCAACTAEVSALLRVKEMLRAQTMPRLPASLIAEIEAQTIHQPSRWFWLENFRQWGPLVAGSLALAVWAFTVFQNVRLQEQSPRVPLQALLARAQGREWSVMADHSWALDDERRVAVHRVTDDEMNIEAAPADTSAAPADAPVAPTETPPQP